jgi:hypothetical protein
MHILDLGYAWPAFDVCLKHRGVPHMMHGFVADDLVTTVQDFLELVSGVRSTEPFLPHAAGLPGIVCRNSGCQAHNPQKLQGDINSDRL